MHFTTILSRRTSPPVRWMTLLLGLTIAAPVLAAQPDAWITTKSKLTLLTTDGVSATAVSVDTINQHVTLHGTVRTTEEKAKAASAVAKIEGVKSVRNLLQVVAEKNKKAVERSDAELREHVEKALKADPVLKPSRIRVESVNNGVVLLSGQANSMLAHLGAIEVVSNVPGVRHVSSEIQSPDVIADSEIWREHASVKPDAGYDAVDAARDAWMTGMVKMRLLADRRTPALEINVDTRDQVVTLFGIVADTEAKVAAESDVNQVQGVRKVRNELQVVAAAKQPAVEARDADVQRDVDLAFQNRPDLKGITVEIKNCVARLSGAVGTGGQRLEAAVVARSTVGVCSVQDDLRVAS